LKILISGHNGFLGKHLRRKLKTISSTLNIDFLTKSDFDSEKKLTKKIGSEDIIFHFAGINRAKTSEIVYEKNKLINSSLSRALDNANFKGKLIFTSSIQESINNPYGNSKKEARLNFKKQSKKIGYKFYGILTPNVFGPFCRPNYNSFISTFSKILIDGESPKLIEDKKISLIYVSDFIDKIVSLISKDSEVNIEDITYETNVSSVLSKLEIFNDIYFKKGKIPDLNNHFDISLFNTFRSYINHKKYFPIFHIMHNDERGSFSELVRSYSKGQTSFSTTKKNVVRGNHYHTRKIERFSVISGKAKIEIREILSDNIISYVFDGNTPSYIDMPIWYTHNIKNIGSDDLLTMFWVNEHYEDNDSDTYIEKV
jgi:UDP-2-acetamido-2,6-beta-L-arabino-hexul-4-ose reductase